MKPVTVEDMLSARDRRVERQRAFLARRRVPLIYLTLNIPGPDKLPRNAEAGFALAVRQVEETLGEKGWPLLESWREAARTGCEACWAVDGPAERIKEAMTALEEATPFGRLLDLDVLDSSGEKLARETPRRCLLCPKPAQVCARSRAHSVEELLERIEAILEEALS